MAIAVSTAAMAKEETGEKKYKFLMKKKIVIKF